EDRRDQLAHRAGVRAIGGALGTIDEQEPAEREESPQRLDAGVARQLERALAAQVQKRRLVQGVARRRDYDRVADIDRRSLLDFPGQLRERARPRVPGV